MYKDFHDDIVQMNNMYKLQVNQLPTDLGEERLRQFQITFQEEVNELNKIIEEYGDVPLIQTFVDLADWMGDCMVFLKSEAVKWGIPLGSILYIIMESNKSKLGADGQPIYDANGKFLKGPNFIPPEPKIEELFMEIMNETKSTTQKDETKN